MYNNPYNPYLPYGGQNPYNNTSQVNSQMEQLQAQLRKIESRLDYGYPNKIDFSQNNPQQSNPPQTKGIDCIPVKSADEAWAYKVDEWRLAVGDKFYFVNDNNGEMYVKWFDANNAKTYNKIYREIDDEIKNEQTEIIEQKNLVNEITPVLNSMSDKLEYIVVEIGKIPTIIKRIKELDFNIGDLREEITDVQNSAKLDMELHGEKTSAGNRRKQDNESGNGSGKTKS